MMTIFWTRLLVGGWWTVLVVVADDGNLAKSNKKTLRTSGGTRYL
jgi:hypothetical protein